jgi:hypothetical protein
MMTLCLGAAPTFAQSSDSDSYRFSQDELDELVAPIALYPDELVGEILMAATYPLEVAQAARFVREHPGLTDQALEDAAQVAPTDTQVARSDTQVAPTDIYTWVDARGTVNVSNLPPPENVRVTKVTHGSPQAVVHESLPAASIESPQAAANWDPSVQSLTAFPQVLLMMNDKLDWTQRLGDAFIGQEQQVMDTVQKLRERAREAGNLNSNAEQRVVDQDGGIVIEPAQPDDVYVPDYNPTLAYGTWWAPGYVPFYWVPPRIYGHRPYRPSHRHWGWAHPDWRAHNVHVDAGRNPTLNELRYRDQYQQGVWQHVPEHRRGVSYRDNATRSRLTNIDPAAAQGRLNFRGRELTPTPSASGPQRSRPVPDNLARPSPAPAQQPPALTAPRAAMPGNVQRPVTGFAPAPRTDQGFNRAPTPVAPPVFRQPAATPPAFPLPAAAPPVFNPAPRNQVEFESNRGRASLGAPATSAPPAAPMMERGHR